jgi:predicted ATP-dependent protease
LFGTIDRVVDRFGRVVTNFTRIKSGSFLRAHGGYLIFSLDDALTEPAVWKVGIGSAAGVYHAGHRSLLD